MQQRFSNRTVIVTGGGSGLGRAMAIAFAAEGARACVIGRRQEKLDQTVASIERGGGKAFGLSADVRDPARVEEVMREIVERTGRIDVLVNNAAGNFVYPSEELSPNGFKSVVDIVLLGTFYCSRFAFKALEASNGSILNIVAAYAWSGEPGAVHSASAKAGVLAMTRTLAAEWGRFGIRVNAIAPGPVHTEGTDKNLWSVADVEKRVRARIPLGRLGEPDDIAKAALWLSSEEASWISGAVLPVDGAQWLSGGTLNFREAYDAMRTAKAGSPG
ncbi:MAG: SDR family oxidoreductase [Candidatus Eremiobacteraeota bacterium]|nr:SDR family oxidoreductase [Candidatus Eremiobacteraeota bacterium]MBV8374670.1 SDR family oxidoreductase [Candidatus Eremiobacteraeota bacterium]